MFDAGLAPKKRLARREKRLYFPTVCVLENHNCGFAETHVVESGKIALETSAFRSILTCLSGACEFSSLTRSRAILMSGPLLPPACVESGNKPPPVQRHGAISHTRRGVRRSAEARSPLGSAATETPAPLGLARVPRPPAHARCPPRSPRPPPPSPSRPAQAAPGWDRKARRRIPAPSLLRLASPRRRGRPLSASAASAEKAAKENTDDAETVRGASSLVAVSSSSPVARAPPTPDGF